MAKKKASIAICEATRSAAAEVHVESDDPNYPYRVCKDAAKRLKACALTPLEWYRLAAVHGSQAFMLHEDFYDDAGKAMQPGMRVPRSPGPRLPSFQDVHDDMEQLLDYYFSRRDSDEADDIFQAMSRFDKAELFQAVERRLGNPPRKALEAGAYLIFQRVLPQELAAACDRRWQSIEVGPFGELNAVAELAAASVPAVGVGPTLNLIRQSVARLGWPDATNTPAHYGLPFTVAFHLRELVPATALATLVLELMDKLPAKRRGGAVLHAFTNLRDERFLDWIECNAAPPISYEWGTAVAYNEPTWERLAQWLEKGRPLSLIALDALSNCRGFDPNDDYMSGIFREVSPKIRGPVSLGAVRRELERYLRVDPVPRVQKVVAVVLANLEKLFDSHKP